MTASQRRRAVEHLKNRRFSERRACRTLGQARATQRKVPRASEFEKRLVARIIELAIRFGRYGYRRITALLKREGWRVNHKRVERIWRQEGLKVPKKQPKRGRLWFNDGSCARLRPEYRNHVWSYAFVHCRTDDGKVFRTLNILDEFSRECLAIRVKRKLNSTDVTDALTDQFILRGPPAFVRSDNGPEFVAQAVRDAMGLSLVVFFAGMMIAFPLGNWLGRIGAWRGRGLFLGSTTFLAIVLGAAPNPFNPATAIRFELPASAPVTLDIFDGRGRLVRRLVDEDGDSSDDTYGPRPSADDGAATKVMQEPLPPSTADTEAQDTVLADWLMQRVKTLDRRPKASTAGLTSFG